MDKIGRLKKSLSQYFNWNKARLDCFARLILSLFAVRTVNLKEIALGFASSRQVDSRYRRLQRFFAQFKWDYCQLGRWLFLWFFKKDQKIYLIIDRTNWYWGKKKINILMLSAAYEGIAIPLVWQMLNKAGNASAKEHCEIISCYVEWFGSENILGVLADREFASDKFFGFLLSKKIPFFIRIKDNAQVVISGKKLFSVKKLFSDLKIKEMRVFGAAVFVYQQRVYLTASRSERGELMVVATLNPCKNAIPVYLRRWEVECLFHSLKGRGFNFEATHMTKQERISTLVGVLAVAFCWAHKIGEWKALIKTIIFKKFRHQKRPQYTYFHYGLDFIREILLNPLSNFYSQFSRLLELLPRFSREEMG
jgi:Transposase DDE domain